MRWFSKLLIALLIAFPLSVGAQNLGPPAAGIVGIGSGVTLQVSGLNPTGNATTTPTMMGLGSSCTITPTHTTRVFALITGELTNTVSGAQATTHARFGTGTAPANAAAVTGTVVGAPWGGLANPANWIVGGVVGGIITGLTINTPIWLDVDMVESGGGTASLTNVTCMAFEF